MSCSDTDTVVGLPRPIHESIKTLKQVRTAIHYTSSNLFLTGEYHEIAVVLHMKFSSFFFSQHKYVSIAEIQIAKEEEFQKTPLSGVSGNTNHSR